MERIKYSAYKIFILKLIFFLIPVFIFLIYTELALRRYNADFDKTTAGIEKFMNEIEILILGNSQEYFGFKPEKLTFNAFSFSHDNQSLQYDMLLTGNYLPMLKKLKAVVIPVSGFSLHYDMHKTKGICASGRYDNGIFSIRKYSLIAAYTPEIAFRIVFLKNFRSSEGIDLNPEKSSFLKGKNSMIAYSLISRHHDLIQQDYQPDIKNLEKFIALLQGKKIEVVFTTIPVSAFHHGNINENDPEKSREMINSIVSRYGCKFIDIESNLRLGDEYFSDLGHLNARGAEIVTAKLDSAMKNAILVTRN